MKQRLNAAGVAFVQASELSKTKAELARSILELQTDFDAWMDACFLLSTTEQEQLESLDASFKVILAEAIASELSAGRTIGFAKEKPKEEDYRDKDILIFGTKQQTYSLLSEQYSSEEGLQLVIRYR